MNSIYAITTHHSRPTDAAEAWHECGVCAIGWYAGDHRFDKAPENDLEPEAKLFLHLKKGDLILAYPGDNRIAYVGEIRDQGNIFSMKRTVLAGMRGRADLGMRTRKKSNGTMNPMIFQEKTFLSFMRSNLGDAKQSTE